MRMCNSASRASQGLRTLFCYDQLLQFFTDVTTAESFNFKKFDGPQTNKSHTSGIKSCLTRLCQ